MLTHLFHQIAYLHGSLSGHAVLGTLRSKRALIRATRSVMDADAPEAEEGGPGEQREARGALAGEGMHDGEA
eukprot:11224089-Lingulodinium_polyedra.AAC.1